MVDTVGMTMGHKTGLRFYVHVIVAHGPDTPDCTNTEYSIHIVHAATAIAMPIIALVIILFASLGFSFSAAIIQLHPTQSYPFDGESG